MNSWFGSYLGALSIVPRCVSSRTEVITIGRDAQNEPLNGTDGTQIKSGGASERSDNLACNADLWCPKSPRAAETKIGCYRWMYWKVQTSIDKFDDESWNERACLTGNNVRSRLINDQYLT